MSKMFDIFKNISIKFNKLLKPLRTVQNKNELYKTRKKRTINATLR